MSDNLSSPNTRAILLDGLRQGLQGRVVKIYDVLSSAGETDAKKRGQAGLERAVEAYENAWAYIDEAFK